MNPVYNVLRYTNLHIINVHGITNTITVPEYIIKVSKVEVTSGVDTRVG